MINKRLIKEMRESFRMVLRVVACNWLALLLNTVLIVSISHFFALLYNNTAAIQDMLIMAGVVAGAVLGRMLFGRFAARFALESAAGVKLQLRSRIFTKILQFGSLYNQGIGTAELVQIAGEGVEQLEVYFGAYLSQFFYGMLAPLTLFAVLCWVNLKVALVLLACVPLIPLAIVAVMKVAKRLLHKYWGVYVNLGDDFLENLQGLVTLKIYNQDEPANIRMNENAESFRRVTMKVLTMQLSSITIMDLVAYGGAALAIVLGLFEVAAGSLDVFGFMIIVLLSSEFFIPLRLLGSLFHTAMNGAAASDRIFAFLDLPVEAPVADAVALPEQFDIVLQDVDFAYNSGEGAVLHGVNMQLPQHQVTAIVGQSGCGKSTIARLLMHMDNVSSGAILLGGHDIRTVDDTDLYRHIHLLSSQSYIFSGTVREHLLLARPDADEQAMWAVLKQVRIDQFIASQDDGLDYVLKEAGNNLSGGQRQRLALARAILCDAPIYIFDEATSSVDADTEEDIVALIYQMAKTKTVILISHRLANVRHADTIYMLAGGRVAESGTHEQLLGQNGLYAQAVAEQQALEQLRLEG